MNAKPLLNTAIRLSILGLSSMILASPQLASTALAGPASQLTEDSYAPAPVKPGKGGVAIAASTGPQAPEGAETLFVTPSGLVVEGGIAAMQAQTNAIEARLAGRRVMAADLFKAAADLEAAYAQAGYILARVSLPPQTLTDGQPLRLVVTDGYVEAVDTSAFPDKVRTRLDALLAPLVGQAGLTRQALERRLLLAAGMPGVTLNSTLKAGSKAGATVIVVDGRFDPMRATVAVDNGTSTGLGSVTVSTGLDLNNALGFGEVFYLRLNGYPGFGENNAFSSDPRNRQIVAGVTMPLGTDGLWTGFEAVDSRTNGETDLPYSLPNHYWRLSGRLGYDWRLARDHSTGSIMALDIMRETQELEFGSVTTPFTEDRLMVLRLTQTGDLYTSWGGQLSGSATASFGIDAFDKASMPMSRDGASPSFNKLSVDISYVQPLAGDRLQLSLAGQAQTSFGDPLPGAEQMSLGGLNWLSAFNGSDLQADTGAVIRSELSMPFAFEGNLPEAGLRTLATPYVFAAAGIASLAQPTAAEQGTRRAAAFGVGVNLAMAQQESGSTLSLKLEYARGHISDTGTDSRINLRLESSF